MSDLGVFADLQLCITLKGSINVVFFIDIDSYKFNAFSLIKDIDESSIDMGLEVELILGSNPIQFKGGNLNEVLVL